MTLLNVNIDHVATLRQARGGSEPDPVKAALAAEKAGAAGIVAHLREDRRHILDGDLFELRRRVSTRLNMEMAATAEMTEIALSVLPDTATLVPEKREELTTEGGLDVAGNRRAVAETVSALQEKNVAVSLFIEPSPKQVEASADIGADMVEIHTGALANASSQKDADREMLLIKDAVSSALSAGLRVAAGHGLDYGNAGAVAGIKGMEELNIGYSIVCRAVFDGMEKAVRDMVAVMGGKTG